MNIAQLARQLNLSTAAVSKALNDKPDISEETKKLVKEAARRYGYSPNVAARQLKHGRSRTIALVLPPDGVNDFHTSYFFHKIIIGLHAELTRHGYLPVMYVPSDAADEMKQIERFLTEKVVDGVIVTDTHYHDKRIDMLRRLGLPFAAMGGTSDLTGLNFVDMNYVQMLHDAVGLAISRGWRDLVAVSFGDDCFYGLRTGECFLQALRDFGLPSEDSRLLLMPKHADTGAEAMCRIMNREHLPDCALFVNADLFFGALNFCRLHNINKPRPFCLIPSSEFFNLFNPYDHAFEIPFKDIGENLGKAILNAIKDPAGTSPLQIIVDVPLKRLR